MKDIVDYKKNILQVMGSIRAYEQLPIYHGEDPEVTRWLCKHQFQQVIVLLVDGMGAYQIRKYCDKDSFLKRHMIKHVDTVYPPTTTAATTSILNGKTPCENAWLGWQQYFSEIDEHLIMFLNQSYYGRMPYKVRDYSYTHVPVSNMVDECISIGRKAKEIYPVFRKDGVNSFDEMCERIVKESQTKEYPFIYAYWDEYDSCMHDDGASDERSIAMLQSIDTKLQGMVKRLGSNTGLLVIADHGHIDVISKNINDYPAFLACLKVLPSLEPRTPCFYIKEGYTNEFLKLFNRYFSDDFILFSRQEVLESHLFGYGEEHPLFQSFIGDYIACATRDVQLVDDYHYDMKGHHAGTTREEIEIPVVLYPQIK